MKPLFFCHFNQVLVLQSVGFSGTLGTTTPIKIPKDMGIVWVPLTWESRVNHPLMQGENDECRFPGQC